MRILIVSSSLPNSLTVENFSKEAAQDLSQTITKKVISTSFSSINQVKQTILAGKNSKLDYSAKKPAVRRSRTESTTNLRTSISLINNPDDQSCASLNESINPESVWKFTQMSGHSAIAAASSLPNNIEKVFIGWPGPIQNEQKDPINYSELPPNIIQQIEKLYLSETDSIPVFIESKITQGHANYCNTTLWPIFHYLVWENPNQCKEMVQDWKDYVKVNEAFAEKILQVYKTGDVIWILNHHLLLLPGLLSQRIQSAPIGLYLRNTFPSSELFRCLPQAEELLTGMLGANLIGFQAYAYARHFTSCCTRVLGLEASLQRIDYEGAPVELAVVPTGIEATEVLETLKSSESQEKYQKFKEMYHGIAVLTGIDRSNQCKGIIHKLKSYERFLRDHPEWVGRVILIQVILPEQDIPEFNSEKIQSADLSLITDMAAQINSQYGSIEYAPISIYYQDIELSEYYALLQVADCFISTSERDGLSLSPLDFILCQEFSEKRSPIVLSEFTALSGSMSTSILINPWDHLSVAQAINTALTMSTEEKHYRHEVLIKYVMKNSRNNWSETFLKYLLASKEMIEKYGPTSYLDFSVVKSSFKQARERYFFLDYDGTLTPIVKTPSAAVPGSKTIESLRKLTRDPLNKVFVISGRDCHALEHWLGVIEHLGMSAEHGCFLKLPDSSEWQNLIENQNEEWKAEVLQVFEYFTERTPGSFVEKKSASITWHYRQCDPDFGSWQAKQCQSLLENTISGKMSVEILAGKKNLEVRPISINKGQTLRRILCGSKEKIQADFIFCAGDDRTDEDMFKSLVELHECQELSKETQLITCAIGPAEKKTLARFHVNNPEQLINLLYQLTTE